MIWAVNCRLKAYVLPLLLLLTDNGAFGGDQAICILILAASYKYFCSLDWNSAYQIVVEELHPHRAKREAGAMDCYQVPVTYHSALSGGSPYYFAAELPPGNLPEPAPFTVGDNRTYQGFWNPPLAPRKGYNIYFQAMSSVEKVNTRSS